MTTMQKTKQNVILLVSVICIALSLFSCSNGKQVETNDKESDSIMVEKRIGVKLNDKAGVKELPCVVNGLQMNFIFDTGASNVCISLTEALFMLKNGYLEDIDIEGTSTAQIADGSIVENTIINLHSIEIGGIMITDVKATVVNSLNSPLLLGQSVIKRLGKIEIDEDSLYIIKTVAKEKSKEEKEQTAEITTQRPDDYTWWDKVKIFFGNHDKSDEFAKYIWNLKDDELYELAEDECTYVIKNDREFWPIWYLRGVCEYNNEKYSESYSSLIRASEMNKNNEDYLLEDETINNGKVYVSACLSALELNEESGEAIIIDYHGIIKLAQKSLQYNLCNEDKTKAYASIIVSLRELKQYEESRKWAMKLCEADKAYGYFHLGRISNDLGRDYEAIRYYEKCIELAPEEYPGAYNNLAVTYYSLKHYSTSLAYRIKAARLGNKNSIKWLNENGIEY